MSVFKNLIFLPLGLIAAYSRLPDFPWWLELIYFHLLPANEISLTFLHETLQRILLMVLNSFPPFWQLYAQWGVVQGCGEFSGCTWAQLHPQEIGPLGFASFSQLYLLQCLSYWVSTLHLRVYTPSQISVASLLSLQRSAPPKRLRFGGKAVFPVQTVAFLPKGASPCCLALAVQNAWPWSARRLPSCAAQPELGDR